MHKQKLDARSRELLTENCLSLSAIRRLHKGKDTQVIEIELNLGWLLIQTVKTTVTQEEANLCLFNPETPGREEYIELDLSRKTIEEKFFVYKRDRFNLLSDQDFGIYFFEFSVDADANEAFEEAQARWYDYFPKEAEREIHLTEKENVVG